MTTRIGQIVAGKYRIVERIGSGAMGEVFRASSIDDVGSAEKAEPADDVAIKILRPDRAREREAVARFLAEVRAMRALSHPSIVRVLSEGETDDHVPFVAMELLRGEALRTTLQRHGRMDRATAISLIIPVLEALEVAHEHGVLHRDVKPENVFLSAYGGPGGDVEVKVVDFGIAKVLDASQAVGHNTTIGVVVGTPGYFAPEQASGERELDGRVDVFAVGAILFELLTGRRAFDGPSPVVAAWKVVSEPASRLVDCGIEGAADLQMILDRALAKKPADRFPHARAFLDAVTPLAPSDVGRRVLLSSLLSSPGRVKRAPPPPSNPTNVHMSPIPARPDVGFGEIDPIPPHATTGFVPTMKSTQDPLAAKLHARPPSMRRVVRLAEESSSVDTPALALDSRDFEPPSTSTSSSASSSWLALGAEFRGKHRARAGWIRSLVNGLERDHSVATVASWIDALPAEDACAIRVASLDPDAWAPFDALHALYAIGTARIFDGDATKWRVHTKTHAHDLAARLDRWSPHGALGPQLAPTTAAAWWSWWPGARSALFDVGTARALVPDAEADAKHAANPARSPASQSVVVHIDDASAASLALRHAELGLLEALLARAGFAVVRAEPLPGPMVDPMADPTAGATHLGQEFRYRVTWG